MNSNLQASDVSAAVRNTFNFTVDKFPLSGPDNMPTDQYGLFRSDTGYIDNLKSVSSQYVPHSTDDVCALVEAASDLFDGKIHCNTHWNKGHYVSIRPTDADRISIFGTRDNIFPRVIIRGGYDGRGFQGTIGYYRDACRNLAMLRSVDRSSVTIRHTGKLRQTMNQLIATFGELKEGWDSLAAAAKSMQEKKVKLSDFIDQVYANTAVRNETVDRRNDSLLRRIVSERVHTGRQMLSPSLDMEVTAWEAYNAVQGRAQHEGRIHVRSYAGENLDLARILKASNDRHVKRAELIALAV